MSRPQLLITGCSGLIGRILWNGLSEEFELYGLDRTADGPPPRIFQADLAQPEQIERVFQHMSAPRYIVHLAGASAVNATWDDIWLNNIGGTRNMYEAARLAGAQRIVFASSNHVTGAYEGRPPRLHRKSRPKKITVHDPIRPDGFYGFSKAAGEALARTYFEVYGLESICLRIGSVNTEDDPRIDPRFESTWLSHRDLLGLVRASLSASVGFGIYYGVSNNAKRFWDLSNARRELGYRPADNASARYTRGG